VAGHYGSVELRCGGSRREGGETARVRHYALMRKLSGGRERAGKVGEAAVRGGHGGKRGNRM
jgi:hypothetical protein